MDDNRWHRLAFIWNQAKWQQQLSIDGKQGRPASGPQGGMHSGARRLGTANPAGPFLGRVIDEFRLYAHPLTAEEIQTLFDAVPDEDRQTR